MSEQVFTNCTNAGPFSVYVNDGKGVRIRPLVANGKDFEPWTVQAGKADSVDRGGCVNLLTLSRMLSGHAPAVTPNSCRIEIEKW